MVARAMYPTSSLRTSLVPNPIFSLEFPNTHPNDEIGHGNAYSLDFDSYWSSMDAIDGDGIYYHNITFQNWTGTAVDGETRPPIRVICPEDTPCTEISLVQIDLWVEEGAYDEYVCKNAYGSGYCLDSATGTTTPYSTTTYVNSAPTGYEAPTMTDDLATAFGTSASIPIPTIPASFFPGVTPISALAGSS